MIKWLQDSYNGLYKVLLERVTPRRAVVGALIAGVVLGLLWAYLLAPIVFYDADPNSLHQSWQDTWVLLLADANAAANADVSQQITTLLAQIDDPLSVVDRLLADPNVNTARLQAIRPYAQAAGAGTPAPKPDLIGNLLPFIIAPLLIAAVFVILAWLYGLFIFPNLIEPLLRRGSSSGPDDALVQVRQEMTARREAEATFRTDFTTTTYGKPLMQRMSVYIPGRGQFDDSFSIEDENEKFLGECGAGISEVIGVGDPAKVTAIEVWLFDKDDFVRTLTHVFASEHAYHDPGLRAKLEPKGPIVLVKPGAVAVLETASLRLQARIVEVEYGDGALPPNSHFNKLTIELAAWRKQPGSAPAAPEPVPAATVPAAPAPVYAPMSPPVPLPADPTFGSPIPPAPSFPPPTPGFAPSPQPPSPGLRPLTPPPLSPPTAPPRPPVDDDPFGGTGDFRPMR